MKFRSSRHVGKISEFYLDYPRKKIMTKISDRESHSPSTLGKKRQQNKLLVYGHLSSTLDLIQGETEYLDLL